MLSDIEIAQKATMKPIGEIADKAGIPQDALEFYGKYKAKISEAFIQSCKDRPDGKLVLVTAINPTPKGEGKTTVTVGLGDALTYIGKNTIMALREPSLGPVMGVKGGATGGGYAQVLPMEEINLHFTGDMHAITAANNLLCAMLDNHLFQGNELDIDVNRVVIKRCVDMNDRALRNIVIGMGGPKQGIPRESGFVITVATEVMAVLCLAEGLEDLKARLGRIVVAYNRAGEPVYARDLKAQGAMALLLKDALKPNLVQTIDGTPAIMHGGPFANIAHGCNSVRATKLALKLADYCITEAGFGADLGAEKFLDIKCRQAGLKPSAVVIVATLRALLHHGNGDLQAGLANLGGHIENIQQYGLPCIVAINRFADDSPEQLDEIAAYCMERGVPSSLTEVHGKGGAGGVDLAEKLVRLIEEKDGAEQYAPVYPLDLPLRDKIEMLAAKIYGASGVTYSARASETLDRLEAQGFGGLPICVAKTQYSFSDNAKLLGRPRGFTLSVADVTLSNGAGFVVVMTGSILALPGLPKEPAANKLDVFEDGTVTGLF